MRGISMLSEWLVLLHVYPGIDMYEWKINASNFNLVEFFEINFKKIHFNVNI